MPQRIVRLDATRGIVTGLFLVAMLMLTACNTVSGQARDVAAAGDTLSDTAEDVQE